MIRKYLEFINEGFLNKKPHSIINDIIKYLDSLTIGQILKTIHKRYDSVKDETKLYFSIDKDNYILICNDDIILLKNGAVIIENHDHLTKLRLFIEKLYSKVHRTDDFID